MKTGFLIKRARVRFPLTCMALCVYTGKGHARTGRWQPAAVWVPGRVFLSASGSARWTSASRRVRNASRVIHPVSPWHFVMAADTIQLTFARIRGRFVEVTCQVCIPPGSRCLRDAVSFSPVASVSATFIGNN